MENQKELTLDELKTMITDVVKENLPEVKQETKIMKTEAEEKAEGLEVAKKFICDVVEGKAVDTTAGSMGYTVPTELASAIQEKKDKLAKMRKVAFVFQFAGKFQLPQEGTGVTAYWVDENDTITESNPTVGKKDLDDYYLAGRVLAPRKLLNTSAYNIVEFISRLIARSLVNTEETAFVAGDGSSKPTGLRGASVSSVAQAGSGLVYDDIVNLYYGLAEQYRGMAIFMTSALGMKALRKIKDDNGVPIFDPAKQELFGRPIWESSDIPSNLGTSANETEIWFFDPSYYWIKDGENMFMETDKIISKLQTEIVVSTAVDGVMTLTDAGYKLTGVK
jgi:HK97 family phage major capsid protein